MATMSKPNWNNVGGGARGYLYRCQEALRMKGIRYDDAEGAIEVLGSEAYFTMLKAADEVKRLNRLAARAADDFIDVSFR
jgi:hypothetical protein